MFFSFLSLIQKKKKKKKIPKQQLFIKDSVEANYTCANIHPQKEKMKEKLLLEKGYP